MQKIKINDGWQILNDSVNPLVGMLHQENVPIKMVDLPYDAMIHEKRLEDTVSGSQTGFYPGKLYYYIKKIYVPEDWKEKTITLEFEGIYMISQVYINGDYAGGCLNGYSNFYVHADEYLKYGEENEIKVCANNAAQPNSRWYSGSGIYRNVNLYMGDLVHIGPGGLKIKTTDIDKDSAVIEIHIRIENKSLWNKPLFVNAGIINSNGDTVQTGRMKVTSFAGKKEEVCMRLPILNPLLWDCENPALYTCQIRLLEGEVTVDEETVVFGIRSLSLDAVHGLRINGKETKLRGACVHHDNGIIGANTLEAAEERRVKQLKKAGFNCLRSAHQPMSKAMLDACDRLGMLVIDELSDIWTRAKNISDYSLYFSENWEEDAQKIVDKDYNHPCVIIYSLGNEIQEAGTARGAALNRQIHNKFKSLDDTRYTTNAINGMLAASTKLGLIFADIMKSAPGRLAAPAAGGGDKKQGDDAGSNGLNSMMTIMSGPIADAIASHPIMTEVIDEFADVTDIAGYNYLTARHELEKKLHPNRIVLGTETFPADISRLWSIVRNNPHVIGDMTWTGYDYLGEAGCGVYYYDGAKNFTSHWPDSVAYIGDIDLTGYRRPISYLREIVFGLRKDPYIAVERVNRFGQKHSVTPWVLPDDCVASWTWPGYEGQPANLEIYSDAEEVELFLNGISVGRQPAGEEHGYIASYNLNYEPGELLAVSYKDGIENGKCLLPTAGSELSMNVIPDKLELKADGADLAFLTVKLQDAAGTDNLNALKEIRVMVEGGGTLMGLGSADPQTDNYYDNCIWKTYDGYLLAVIRAGREAGEIKVTFESDGLERVVVKLQTIT